jgi:cytochrome c
MLKLIATAGALAALTLGTQAMAGSAGKYGIGTVATPEQVAAWDIDVPPSGTTAFVGQGTAEDGEEPYMELCASCHGEFGDGGDSARYPILVGGSPEGLTNPNPEKTPGSYWPYASTLVDYIYRAMPFGDAQSLTPDQTYAISAWILAENGVIDYDFVLSNENIDEIEMPNAAGFYLDDRPDFPTIAKDGEPCMQNCKPDVAVVSEASNIDVTPETGGQAVE